MYAPLTWRYLLSKERLSQKYTYSLLLRGSHTELCLALFVDCGLHFKVILYWMGLKVAILWDLGRKEVIIVTAEVLCEVSRFVRLDDVC